MLFGLYHVPLGSLVDPAGSCATPTSPAPRTGPSRRDFVLAPLGGRSFMMSSAPLLLAYQALGAFLLFLYSRSGGSLPLVVVTHATLRLIELGGGRMLPF